jgi:hypothetical protein
MYGVQADDEAKNAERARVLRLETMIQAREVCDEAEAVVPANIWVRYRCCCDAIPHPTLSYPAKIT